MKRSSHSVFDESKGIIMGFLGPGEDLLQGIKKACEKHSVSSGMVSCIGSLSKVTVVQPEFENNKMSYSKPVQWDTLVELLSGNGIIGKDESGNLDIHFHGVFIDHRKTLSGGHFLEGGSTVAITVEFTIIVSEVIQAVREIYQPQGFALFNFYKGSGDN